jgi:glutaredoxin
MAAGIQEAQMRHLTVGLFLLVVLFATSLTAEGTLYRWVDENGVVHFDETQPGDAGSFVRVEPGPPNGGDHPDALDPEMAAAAKGESSTDDSDRGLSSDGALPREAELYVTRWCTYCKMAAGFLRSKGVPFKWYDIEKDREAARRKMQLDPNPGVPFAVINGFRIHGFSVEAYEKALSFNPEDEE